MISTSSGPATPTTTALNPATTPDLNANIATSAAAPPNPTINKRMCCGDSLDARLRDQQDEPFDGIVRPIAGRQRPLTLQTHHDVLARRTAHQHAQAPVR